jgi:hypothetical protein
MTNHPTRWAICDACDGEGARAMGGRDFTGSEWRQACNDDPDFADHYFGGVYDTACDCCGGTGKIRVPDYERMTPAQIEAMQIEAEADAYIRAEHEAERRFGC